MKILIESRYIDKYLKSWNMTESMLIDIIYNDLLENNKALQVSTDNSFLSGNELQENVEDIKYFIKSKILPVLYKKLYSDDTVDPRNYQELLKYNTIYKQKIKELESKYEKYLDAQNIVWKETVESL